MTKVMAWDFEVNDHPIVIMKLLPVTPKSVAELLARTGPSAA
jgi:hypothetical protein